MFFCVVKKNFDVEFNNFEFLYRVNIYVKFYKSLDILELDIGLSYDVIIFN